MFLNVVIFNTMIILLYNISFHIYSKFFTDNYLWIWEKRDIYIFVPSLFLFLFFTPISTTIYQWNIQINISRKIFTQLTPWSFESISCNVCVSVCLPHQTQFWISVEWRLLDKNRIPEIAKLYIFFFKGLVSFCPFPVYLSPRIKNLVWKQTNFKTILQTSIYPNIWPF